MTAHSTATRGALARALFGIAVSVWSSGCTGTIGPACGSQVGPPAPAESVRLLTFNTALFSPAFQCQAPDPQDFGATPTPLIPNCYLFNDLGGPIAERANLIADRIDPSRFDIIVFNEVWDEDDGKDVLVDRLCEAYPHYVKYVPYSEDLEDSGLMVFSKFPIAALPDDEFQSSSDASTDAESERVAFVEFDRCSGVDCLAAKGAMLLRTRHPTSDRIINIVATHMQASARHDSDRVHQLRQILGQCETGIPSTHPNLVNTTVRPALPGGTGGLCDWPPNEWLFMMGDLNVDGAGAIGAALFPTPVTPGGPKEWDLRIGSPAASVEKNNYALYDAWAETTSEADFGLTSGSERLDYVLASRVTRSVLLPGGSERQPCVQHIRVPPEFEGLSDHRAVAADINLGAPQCAPRLAVAPTADDMGELGGANGKEARQLAGAITRGGSMQWWRLAEGGTYTVAASDGVDVEFFRAADLGRPLGGSHSLGADTINVCQYFGTGRRRVARCRPEEGEKMVFPDDGPIFVRVFAPERSDSPSYWIAFHKYTCKSPIEACELLPHSPQRFRFPAPGTKLNFEDAAWFNIQVREQADSGAAQTLRFYVENRVAAPWVEPEIELRDPSGTTVLGEIDGASLDQPASRTSPGGRAMMTIDGSTNQNDHVLLRVKRANPDTVLTFLAGWRTNLTLLGGSAVGTTNTVLLCDDETNPEYGDDEIRLEVNVDGGGFQTRGNASFDCNSKPHPRPWDTKLGGVIRFLEGIQFRLFEGDAASADDSSGVLVPDTTVFDRTDRPVGPVASHLPFEFDGGKYFFHFHFSKWRVQ